MSTSEQVVRTESYTPSDKIVKSSINPFNFTSTHTYEVSGKSDSGSVVHGSAELHPKCAKTLSDRTQHISFSESDSEKDAKSGNKILKRDLKNKVKKDNKKHKQTVRGLVKFADVKELTKKHHKTVKLNKNTTLNFESEYTRESETPKSPEIYSTPSATPQDMEEQPETTSPTSPTSPTMEAQQIILDEKVRAMIIRMHSCGQISTEGNTIKIGDLTFAGQPKSPTPTPMETAEPSPEGKFKSPRKTTKIGALLAQPRTTTSNKFAPLSQPSTSAQATAREAIEKRAQQATPKPSKTTPPPTHCPPIVLPGVATDHKALVQELNVHLKKGFYIKYAPKSTLIYIKDKQEFLSYKNKLTDQQEQYHTYSLRDAKTHAFVIKGLFGNTPTDDIKYELKDEHQIEAEKVYKMKTRNVPMYLVVTPSTVTLKDLQTKVRYLSSTKITWERRTNQRPIAQCRRCQGWGHATSNCNRKVACMKCAAPHWTYECTKQADTPATCVNCKGPHTSSSTTCPVYVARIKMLEPKEPQQVYIPAPPPTHNVWDQRRDRSAQQPNRTAQQPSRTGPPPTQTTPARSQIQPQSRPQPAVPDAHESGLSGLKRASTRLSSIINLQDTIRAMDALSDILAECKDSFDAIQRVDNFIQNVLPNYEILRSKY